MLADHLIAFANTLGRSFAAFVPWQFSVAANGLIHIAFLVLFTLWIFETRTRSIILIIGYVAASVGVASTLSLTVGLLLKYGYLSFFPGVIPYGEYMLNIGLVIIIFVARRVRRARERECARLREIMAEKASSS